MSFDNGGLHRRTRLEEHQHPDYPYTLNKLTSVIAQKCKDKIQKLLAINEGRPVTIQFPKISDPFTCESIDDVSDYVQHMQIPFTDLATALSISLEEKK